MDSFFCSSRSSSSSFFLLVLLILSPLSYSYTDLFDAWCAQHNKYYASSEEKFARFRIFQENLAFIHDHNSRNGSSYEVGLNAFADLTHDEFRAARLGLRAGIEVVMAREDRSVELGSNKDVPVSVDWRKKGAVTNVKDQGSCGACWAFSATGAMEGINQIKAGSLVSLSEQELIDCDRTYNSGCAGGLMDYAYKWVVQNHGIDSEDDYPFKAADGTCNQIKANHRVVTIDGYHAVPPKNEDQLLQAVATQPVSVGICGSERSFQLYTKGIFRGPCSTSLDHAVLIVGYGSENGVDYWIIKNSWGSRWGMDGYMYMLRNGGDPQGVCGINLLASYPTKTSPNPPPSPGPTPTKCSIVTYCPAGNTCCCTWHVFGLCLSWSCCELDSAICCKDHRYCCPHDYPVCDVRSKQCFKGNGNVTRVLGIERKSSFVKLGAWNPSPEACYE